MNSNGRYTRLDKYLRILFIYLFKLSTSAEEIRNLSLIAMSRGEFKLIHYTHKEKEC